MFAGIMDTKAQSDWHWAGLAERWLLHALTERAQDEGRRCGQMALNRNWARLMCQQHRLQSLVYFCEWRQTRWWHWKA